MAAPIDLSCQLAIFQVCRMHVLRYLCTGALAATALAGSSPHQLRRLVDAPTVSNGTLDSAKKFSQDALKFLTNLRGGDSAFYQHLVTTFKIKWCELDVNSDSHSDAAEVNAVFSGSDDNYLPYYRFVPSASKYALKNSTGQCTQVKKPSADISRLYNNNYCEVKANCYWRDVDPTSLTDRVPVYTTKQGPQPPDGDYRVSDADEFLKTYAKSFGSVVLPPLILLILSIISIILFIICRCCCNKCGGRQGKPGGYTCMEKFLPILFFLLFAIAILVLAALSYVYWGVVTTSVGNIFDFVQSFIDKTIEWTSNLLIPLNDIGATVISSSDSISTQLDGSGFIEDGLTGITNRLTTFAASTDHVTLPLKCVVGQDAFCTACQVCTNINTQITGVNQQISSAAGSGVSQLKTTRGQIKSSLLDAKSTIRDVVKTATTKQQSLIDTLNKNTQPIVDIHKTWNDNTQVLKYAIVALFALSIVVIVLGLLGILFGLTPLRALVPIMHLAYSIAFIAIIVTFVLSAAFLGVSVLLGDVCQVADILSANWTTVLGDTGKIVDTCFQNTSLIEVLNLAPQLAFATSITFPTLDVNSMLSFSSLDQFASTIGSTTSSTFQVDTTLMQTALQGLNNQTTVNQNPCVVSDGRYTVDNILTPWLANSQQQTSGQTGEQYMKSRYSTYNTACNNLPTRCSPSATTCQYSDFVTEMWKNVSTLRSIQLDAASFVTNMTTNMTNLVTYVNGWKSNIRGLANNISAIGTSLGGTLIKDVNSIKSLMTCEYVATTYNSIDNEFCVNMVPSFLMIALFLFLMGIFLIPVIITLIIMAKRLRHKHSSGGGSGPEGDTKFK
ncbi:hypothetical protein AC1031_004963 [Aphanomyces cochlioides]|nr:hypothetical protein AC1031_004963 [Aphanomyces cochlioides]